MFNPLMPKAAQSNTTMLVIFFKEKYGWENIWIRNDNQNTANNSHPHILLNCS